MNPLLAALLAAGSAPLALPVLLGGAAEQGSNVATLASGNFDVTPGDFLVVGCFSRDGDASTHDSLVASNFTCTFTQLDTDAQADATNTMRLTVYTGTVSAGTDGAGDGFVTLTASAAQFQQAMLPLRIPGGSAVDQFGKNKGTATTLAVTPGGTPDAAALGLVFVAHNSESAVPALSGYSDTISGSGYTGSLRRSFFAKLGSPGASWSITGLQDTRATVAIGVTVL